MSDEYAERCERAAMDLEEMARVASVGLDRARLLDKAEGVRLALSYLRDYPTADAELLGKVREAAISARDAMAGVDAGPVSYIGARALIEIAGMFDAADRDDDHG